MLGSLRVDRRLLLIQASFKYECSFFLFQTTRYIPGAGCTAVAGSRVSIRVLVFRGPGMVLSVPDTAVPDKLVDTGLAEEPFFLSPG